MFSNILYQWIIENTSAIWQQAAHTAYQLSSLSCSTLNKKMIEHFWERCQEQKNNKTERVRGPGTKMSLYEREDRKEESNDKPEIPDITHPGLHIEHLLQVNGNT